MKLEKRIEKIEEKLNIKHGCFLLVTIWDGSEGPIKEQSAQFLKHQKESGLCENLTRQRNIAGGRGVPAGDNMQHDWSFVIGKGYRETRN